MEVLEYLDSVGNSPFAKRFHDLDARTAAKVTAALNRLALGNISNTKSVSTGVMELKIDFGPGYRVYFGKDGEVIVILLGGGTKQRQHADIAAAHQRWRDYKQPKG
jgi:putative addiction module killer protein